MLDQSSLASELTDVFEALPETAEAAALALANAYRAYAADGAFGASSPVILDVQRDAMKSTLFAAIEDPTVGAPATIAAAWSAAVTAFWIGVPVTGPQTGATVGCPGASALVGSLTPVFANVANTAEMCANGLAAALHTATMTVTATVAPPPGTVVPIS